MVVYYRKVMKPYRKVKSLRFAYTPKENTIQTFLVGCLYVEETSKDLFQ